MPGAPRPPSQNNESLPDILSNAFDFAKTFGQYEVAPQTFLQGNQRLTPGLLDGYEYSPQPGETQDDAGRWYAPDGQLIQFVDGPALAGLLDLFPAVGGLAAPVKGAGAVLGAGPLRLPVRPVEELAMDPTVRDFLAGTVDAGRKRSGTMVNGPDDVAKLDNQMMKMSLAPSKNAYSVVDRAGELGYGTQAYHITGEAGTGRPGSLVPWRQSNPHLGRPSGRGSVYFGNRPSVIVKSGAAVGADTGNKYVHSFMLQSPIQGEHGLPLEFAKMAPNQLPFVSSAPDAYAASSGVADMTHALRNAPHREAAVDQWLSDMSANAAARGASFNKDELLQSLYNVDERVAKSLIRGNYDPTSGGFLLGDEYVPAPGGVNAPGFGIPHYSTYEAGAKLAHGNVPGAHSPYQTSLLGAGYRGSRIVDETQKVADGKTFAMHDMPGIRSMNAKFDPRRVYENDTLAGMVPPGWVNQLYQPDQQEPQL